MDVTNGTLLTKVGRKHRDADEWLRDWVRVVSESQWHSIVDVRQQFSAADGYVQRNGVAVTVFNVRGNRYRLRVLIDYNEQVVQIVDVLTHEEYDLRNRKDW